MRNFHVYIIESPRADDLYHGRFEGESIQKSLKLAGVSSTLRLTVNKEAFTASFSVGLVEYFKSCDEPPLPIIHISAHGNKDGIELTDKTFINWDYLKNLLIPVNKVLNGGLLISLSACSGSSGCIMSMKPGVFPFHSVVGNTESPTWAETNIAYSTFYHLFKKGEDIEKAVEAMKVASGNPHFVCIKSADARLLYMQEINRVKAINTINTSTTNRPSTRQSH